MAVTLHVCTSGSCWREHSAETCQHGGRKAFAKHTGRQACSDELGPTHVPQLSAFVVDAPDDSPAC